MKQNQLTFRQYRTIDLAIFAVLLAVAEAVITLGAVRWFPELPYSLSVVLTVVCIVMMRWSGYAAIHAVLGGLVHCLASGAEPRQYLIYCVGSAAALGALFLFRKWKKEEVRVSALGTVGFVITAYVLMQLGRWLCSLPFGFDLMNLVDFLTTDIISLLFACVVVSITRKLDGLFEDQKAYLFRLQREREKEKQQEQEQERIL